MPQFVAKGVEMSRMMMCDGCAEKIHTCDVGSCEKCGGHTSSGAFPLCHDCAEKAVVCMACKEPLPKDADDPDNIVRGID